MRDNGTAEGWGEEVKDRGWGGERRGDEVEGEDRKEGRRWRIEKVGEGGGERGGEQVEEREERRRWRNEKGKGGKEQRMGG